ncbi:Apolipoprotein C-II [Dirofilaria immitis]
MQASLCSTSLTFILLSWINYSTEVLSTLQKFKFEQLSISTLERFVDKKVATVEIYVNLLSQIIFEKKRRKRRS